jgi:hypothetical protein
MESDRLGVDIKTKSIEPTITTLIKLTAAFDIYEAVVLSTYQRSTQEYFEAEYNRLCRTLSASEYVKHVVLRVRQEVMRLQEYAHELPWGLVLEIVDTELVLKKLSDYAFTYGGESRIVW